MDLRDFFRRVRSVSQTMSDPFVVIASKATSDGGKAGVLSYVRREMAARLIVEDKAEMASDEQAIAYFDEDRARRDQWETEQQLSRLQIAVVKEDQFGKLSAARKLQ